MSQEKTQENKEALKAQTEQPPEEEDFQWIAIRPINMMVRYQTVTIASGAVIDNPLLLSQIRENYGVNAPIRKVKTKDLIASGRM